MIRSRRIALVLLLPGLVLLLGGVVIPALTMLLSPPRVDTGEVFDRLGRMLSDPYDLAIIWRTLRIGLTVTGLCLTLGFPTAYLLARSRSRWAGVLLALAIFPLLLSNVVRTYGWLVVLGRNGVVGQTIEGLGLADPAPQLLYTELAVVLGLTQLFLPLAIITCYSAVAQVDANLDEAARGLGAGRIRTLWSVTIPLSMPGIAMAATLVFAGAVTAYTTPYLLGGSRQTMLATQLFRYSGVSLDWAAASATAIIMTVLVLVVYGVSTVLTRAKAVTR
ncbi:MULTISPECIES: ABC transporter permease [Streptomyces]|jgi:putative spermidine/putrescine transport system permease protein|uniref:ABC transporter permease n=1 Tax=Streptomyces TaxID=1883 RepID=UPI001907C385|nr:MULTISPECIES: ABC transporter permease [unclassified Streptomyces]MCU4746112.1 ABC transporter permease [Streptomyces sp. G-5]QQN76438.1 ABC transporter permease [Streptomyces sp. XC 2026]